MDALLAMGRSYFREYSSSGSLRREKTMAEIVMFALKASIITIVFALGLKSEVSDLTSLVRRPSLLARTLLSMLIVMPALAVIIVGTFTLHHAVAVALVALSLSPVPPLLPRKQAKTGGEYSYSIGLFLVASLVSILWIPLAIGVAGTYFGIAIAVSVQTIAKIVFTMILAPLLVGMGARYLVRDVADRIQRPLSILATAILGIAALLILFSAWRAAFMLVGNGTILAFAAFILVGLAVGHFLGGPVPDDRSVLALASASRHPGISLAIAHLNFPNERAVGAAILLYLLLNVVISIPYVRWRAKTHALAHGADAL